MYLHERFSAFFGSGEELNRGCHWHIARWVGVVRGSSNGLVVDLRGLAPAMRRPVVFAIVDKMIEVDCQDSLVLICDHDPSGLGYQLDLRRESRGCYEFDCDQRMDGAWVALVRRRLV